MPDLSVIWERVTVEGALANKLKRSSQVLGVGDDGLYVFGGELVPRHPIDNRVLKAQLVSSNPSTIVELDANSKSPSPRVGSAATTLKGTMYLFSGRGGEAMSPIEEDGALWALDLSSESWEYVLPRDKAAPIPEGRSYHCMSNDGVAKIFLHAGCLQTGRLSDLWCFDTSKAEWSQLASAPEPARGGASVAFSGGLLYRMNGFDGKTEQGGCLDIYNPNSDTWLSRRFAPDGREGPEPRSVSTLLALKVRGRPSLVTLMGERDPSSLGHQGAGKMLGDVWVYDIDESTWTQAISGSKGASGRTVATPSPRGWFAADVTDVDGRSKVVLHGGLGEDNERLGDIWLLSFA